MANGPKKLFQELLALPRWTIAGVVLSHAVLLGVALLGGLPYLIMQAAVAAEILLVSLATIPLYLGRSIGRHAFDTLKLSFALAFLYFFIFVTYGVASGDGRGVASEIAWDSVKDAGTEDLMLSVLYVALSIGAGLWLAFRHSNPKEAWAKSRLLDGAVTMLSMIFVIFAAAIAGGPLVLVLHNFGMHVDVDGVLITFMVVIRLGFSLVAATFTETQMNSIAASPYVD